MKEKLEKNVLRFMSGTVTVILPCWVLPVLQKSGRKVRTQIFAKSINKSSFRVAFRWPTCNFVCLAFCGFSYLPTATRNAVSEQTFLILV